MFGDVKKISLKQISLQKGDLFFFVYKNSRFCRKTFVFSLGKMRIHVGIDREKLEKMLIYRDS